MIRRGLLPFARRQRPKSMKKKIIPAVRQQQQKGEQQQKKEPKFNYEDMMAIKHAMKSGWWYINKKISKNYFFVSNPNDKAAAEKESNL